MVIQCVNDYKALTYPDSKETFIPNGEIGKVINIEQGGLVIDYDGTKIFCPKSSMGNIKLSFSVSFHKCQGGQFKAVILATPKAHTYMLNSNLLYVGETRAREKCYHLGEVKTINTALKKKENYDRKTFLGDLLKMTKY